jgi:periplasmic divalent cation tolerance protein
VTTSSREEAEKIAQCLLDERLIACANIIGPITSIFTWEGKTEKAEEHMILLKTRLELFEKLSEKVKALHSYKVPEIIALPIIKGLNAYLEWLDSSIR